MEPIAEERKSQLFREEELSKMLSINSKNKSAREDFFRDLIIPENSRGEKSGWSQTLRVSGQTLVSNGFGEFGDSSVDDSVQNRFGSLGRSIKVGGSSRHQTDYR